MKNFYLRLSFLLITFFSVAAVSAQEEWPKTITAPDGSTIKIYQPQPESFAGTVLRFRSAISLQSDAQAEPVFGTFWSVANVETDKDARRISFTTLKVPNLKLASETDDNRINYLKTVLETQIPTAGFTLSLDQVLSQMELKTEEKKLSKGLSTAPPKVMYSTRPSILVLIDGAPKLQRNTDWGLDAVVNSPFTIVKNTDGNFYLYGGKKWYSAPAATGPYQYVSNVPPNLSKVESAVNTANSDPGYTSDDAADRSNAVSDIIVSTEPAELIQSKGEADFTSIEGTNLLYLSNSDNDVFMDTNTQQYYLLLSGRWYKSSSLKGGWQYTAANELPADFARIPEGSPKDNVLASVAGTDAAREAVMDAQIPQTAKVDRKTANTNVTYDGAPQFKSIDGTSMEYAVNTPGSVVKYHGRYYTVDNGVWFESASANGPWSVATQRPDEIDIVPPSYPVYNMKYVYIYDVLPDYVYMGYTPGYLNTFIYGPTIVYGTGFYYNPWRGAHYYARPYTWGFGMNYNPWLGWSMGLGYSYDWFNIGFGISSWNYGWGGGWWGPLAYHPPYRSYAYGYGGGRPYGYYGRNGGYATYGRGMSVNRRFTNNIYHYRNDVVTTNGNRFNNSGRFNGNSAGRINNNGNGGFNGNRGGNINRGGFSGNSVQGNPGNFGNRGAQGGGQRERVLSDQQGNVYRRNEGQWQQRSQNQWNNVSPSQGNTVPNLNRQQQMIDRGQSRSQNFQSTRPSGGGGGGFSRPSGGGQSRPSSGGGGGNRGGGRGGRG